MKKCINCSYFLNCKEAEENNKDITKGSEDFICIAIELMSICLILIEIFMK